jgi:hypothetical protein
MRKRCLLLAPIAMGVAMSADAVTMTFDEVQTGSPAGWSAA